MVDDRTARMAVFLVLIFTGFLLYGKSLQYEFSVIDDVSYVVENTDIRRFEPQRIENWFTSQYVLNYIPLTIASYALDYQIWKLNPFGYRFTNLILHCFNAFLIFLILYHLIKSFTIALAVSLIFLVHPVQIENVAWIAERKNLLASFFILISFLSFLKNKLTVSFGFFLFALLSKPNVVVAPIIFFVHDYLFNRSRIILHKKTLFYVACITCAALISAVTIAFHAETEIVVRGGSFLKNFYVMTTVFFRYIGLLLFPFLQQTYYLTKIYNSLFAPAVLSSIVGILGISILIIYFHRKEPKICFWFLWFFVFLLPVSNVVVPIATLMHDRYLYLPIVGFFTVLFLLLERVLTHTVFKINRQLKLALTALVFGLLIFPMAALSWTRIAVWRSSSELFGHELQTSKLPDPRMNFVHGTSLLRSGDIDASIREFDRTLEFVVDERTVLMQAQNYLKKNRPEKAVHYLELYDKHFNQQGSLQYMAFSLYGEYYVQQKQNELAEESFLKSIHAAKKAIAYVQLARLYYNTDRVDRAIAVLNEMLTVDPDSQRVLADLCFYYIQKGSYEASYKIYERLRVLNPRDPFVIQISDKIKQFQKQGAPVQSKRSEGGKETS